MYRLFRIKCLKHIEYLGYKILKYFCLFNPESRQGHGCPSRASVVCVVRDMSLCRADHSSGGVLPYVMCPSVIINPR